MNFDEAFPLKFFLNLGRREDRRFVTVERMNSLGIKVERFPAIDARSIESSMSRRKNFAPHQNGIESSGGFQESTRDFRGYETVGRYALALTQRLAIREAAQRKSPAVLLLEDDVILHPNFNALIETVHLPDDWGIFYLGCTHNDSPSWAGSRVVRASWAVDTHAIAIRDIYYKPVMDALRRNGKCSLGVAKASDQFIAELQRSIPSYACYPNLAWQEVSGSDLLGQRYSNYLGDGMQRNWQAAVDHLLPELSKQSQVCQISTKSSITKNVCPSLAKETLSFSDPSKKITPRLGLLFLTRSDVNHPDIWREFLSEAPDRVEIFSHPKSPSEVNDGFLSGKAIDQYFPTQWGDISLVKASRALLMAALRNPLLTHFVLLSESCIPIRPLPEILRRLELDPRPQFGFRTLKTAHPKHAARAAAVPEIPLDCWRFQSQWWLLDRVSAEFASSIDFTTMFQRMEIPDEAYFATVLSLQGYPLEGNVVPNDITWTSWPSGGGSPEEWIKLPDSVLREIVQSGAFFARKFPSSSDVKKYSLHRSVSH